MVAQHDRKMYVRAPSRRPTMQREVCVFSVHMPPCDCSPALLSDLSGTLSGAHSEPTHVAPNCLISSPKGHSPAIGCLPLGLNDRKPRQERSAWPWEPKVNTAAKCQRQTKNASRCASGHARNDQTHYCSSPPPPPAAWHG